MNGDLSLSESFGGLRIANPDGQETGTFSTKHASPQPLESDDGGPPSSLSTINTSSRRSRSLAPPRDSLQLATPRSVSNLDLQTSNHTPSNPTYRSSNLDATAHDYATNNGPAAAEYYAAVPHVQNSQSTYATDIRQESRIAREDANRPRPVSQLNLNGGYRKSSLPDSGSHVEGGYEPNLPSPLPHQINRQAAKNPYTATAVKIHGIPDRNSFMGSYGSPRTNFSPPQWDSRVVFAETANNARSGPQPTDQQLEGQPPISSGANWQERGAAVRIRQEKDNNGNPVVRVMKKGVQDFDFGRILGEGSYSTVVAATDRQTLREYAIKILDKRHIIKEKKVKYVNIEKDTLNRLTDHPGIVRLYYTFQDEKSLYFVLDLASGGELLGVLKRITTFDEECTRFYGAQILDAIEHMHSRGVIHRDLKPENILLDDRMHVKITDFGTAKILGSKTASRNVNAFSMETQVLEAVSDRAASFVGTAEYVSPELLTDKNATKASDLWAFGCIIYQLLAGRPPFKASNEYQTFQKIVALDYAFPVGFPEVAKDLVERLLVLDPTKRLPVEHVKTHQFFDGVVWGKGLWKQKAPRLRPYMPSQQNPSIRLDGGSTEPNNEVLQSDPQRSKIFESQLSKNRPKQPHRIITELPPPSQLDIDWSPVLTRSNERILKLGNLMVTVTPNSSNSQSKLLGPEAANDTPSKFSRFFGGNYMKRRERLVMITSSAHIIVVAASGQEKKAKMDMSLLGRGVAWKSFLDAKNLMAWSVDTREKRMILEDPKATTSDPDGSKFSTMEWLEALDQAKDIAVSQGASQPSMGDSNVNDFDSAMSSPSSTFDADRTLDGLNIPSSRHNLRKEQADNESLRGVKRFSKRHSKSGLAAVF